MENGFGQIYYYLSIFQTILNLPDWKNIIYSWHIVCPSLLIAYLLGSIPFGLLITNVFGKEDIRKIGSGNIGATNVLRTGRRGLAALTLICDSGKAIIVVWLSKEYLGPDITFFTSIFVVIGHIFPIWLKFHGGKGVACFFGVLFCLSLLSGLISIIIWIMVALIFRFSSLAALVSVFASPILGYFIGSPKIGSIMLILALLVWIRHIKNIQYLILGKENKINLRVS
jgi:glycerol-3-phosphate acyltransferase PlsY